MMKNKLILTLVFAVLASTQAHADFIDSAIKFYVNTQTYGMWGLSLELRGDQLVAEYVKRMAAEEKRIELLTQQDQFLRLGQEQRDILNSKKSLEAVLTALKANDVEDNKLQTHLQGLAIRRAGELKNLEMSQRLLGNAEMVATAQQRAATKLAQVTDPQAKLAEEIRLLNLDRTRLSIEAAKSNLSAADLQRLLRESAESGAAIASVKARISGQIMQMNDRVRILAKIMNELVDKNAELRKNLPEMPVIVDPMELPQS